MRGKICGGTTVSAENYRFQFAIRREGLRQYEITAKVGNEKPEHRYRDCDKTHKRCNTLADNLEKARDERKHWKNDVCVKDRLRPVRNWRG